MHEYEVTIPIVGYALVNVEAADDAGTVFMVASKVVMRKTELLYPNSIGLHVAILAEYYEIGWLR
jgi:hypothetical protein